MHQLLVNQLITKIINRLIKKISVTQSNKYKYYNLQFPFDHMRCTRCPEKKLTVANKPVKRHRWMYVNYIFWWCWYVGLFAWDLDKISTQYLEPIKLELWNRKDMIVKSSFAIERMRTHNEMHKSTHRVVD